MIRCAIRPRRPPAPLGALLLLVVLVPAILSWGCSGKEQGGDPKQILDKAVTAMQGLKGFHVVYDVQRPENAKPLVGLDVVGITGDVAAQGDMEATIDLLQGGVPLQLKFVASGPLHYLLNPTTSQWQAVPAATSPVGQLNLNAGTITVLQRVKDPTYVGQEELGGTRTDHLKGTISGQDVAKIVAALSAEGTFAGDIWIGADDHLVRRIRIEGAVVNGEDPKTVRTVDLSKFNEPVSIKPPTTPTS